MAFDPVCKMEVEPDKAAASYDYQETTYYFCAVSCGDKFVLNPESYIGEKEKEK